MPWWKCLSRFCVQADAVRRPAAVRHEKVDLQRLARIDTILGEIRYALRCKEGVIDEKIPGEALRLFKDLARSFGQDLRLARAADHGLSAEQVPDSGSRDHGRTIKCIVRDLAAQFAGE